IIGRILTVLFSTGIVYILYRTALLIFDKYTALVSVLILSFSLLSIQDSFLIKVDTPMTFWIFLSFLISVKIFYGNSEQKWYLLNGLFIGLAVGTKYTAVFAVVPFILAHLNNSIVNKRPVFSYNLLNTLLLIPIIFVITTPYSIFDIETFLRHLKYESMHYRYGHFNFESDHVSYGYYLSTLYKDFGLLGSVMILIGLARLYKYDRNLFLLIISFPLVYFLFMGGYRTRVFRHMTVVIPFLSLIAGYGTVQTFIFLKSHLYDRSKSITKTILIFFLGLAVLVSLFLQLKRINNYMQHIYLEDTRITAFNWVNKNIIPGTKIAREHATPPLDKKMFPEQYYFPYFGKSEIDIFQYDYLILSSYSYLQYINSAEKYPYVAEKYNEIFNSTTLIKSFIPDNENYAGPEIRIYKIIKNDF
ncbi:ArnT family glycosyltransferase, partial [Bacteroidota bacterium]